MDQLGIAVRVLMVAPPKSMLGDVARRRHKGDVKGLLSHPDIPALNLCQATAIVFLSPLVTDTEYVQAADRLVRQGSEATRRGERARVIVLCAQDMREPTALSPPCRNHGRSQCEPIVCDA